MVAACIVAVIAVFPVTASAATGSWSIVPSPTGTYLALSDVTCVGASDCWAVGSSTGSVGTLIEHNAGNGWVIVTSPTPADASGGAGLNSVTCVSVSDCWAVGEYITPTDVKALIEQYNGSSWTIVPSPGTAGGSLNGVQCVNASNCWAVGSHFISGRQSALIEQYNGSNWVVVDNVFNYAELHDVTCVSLLGDCWAVGFAYNACGTQPAYCTFIEHNTGSGWVIVPGPKVGGAAFLFGVTCVSASDCWAVGNYTTTGDLSGDLTLIEHYDGNSWTVVPSANAPKGHSQLWDLSCASASNCWAVGDHGVNGSRTLTEHYTGGGWVIVTSPNVASTQNLLVGVNCVNRRNCWAVGYLRSSIARATGALIEQHR